MPAVPEFVLRKLYVTDSLQREGDGFRFQLHNSFAPAAIKGFTLLVDGREIAAQQVSLQAEGAEAQPAQDFDAETPYPFAVGVLYAIHVAQTPPPLERLTIQVDTRDAGMVRFTIKIKGETMRKPSHSRWRVPRFLSRSLKATALVDRDAVIGRISPRVYGHFIEHLERCIYDGIWTLDGTQLRADTLALIEALGPPLVRYPGGNFASGYHWEDGIGPHDKRPRRYDEAWQAEESNQVGTDEFMAFCTQVGAEPFLVVNDGSGTPEEAARWVAYCNQPADTEQGRRRAASGHPDPYQVKLWGVGNEVWGEWQIGHTGPQEYIQRLRGFVQAMREVDPAIEIVAVGDKVLSDDPADEGRKWNAQLLDQAGDLIDHLSWHLYQPDREGWHESYDMEALHHTICAAPLDVERTIDRIANQIRRYAPTRQIGIAFDEWNLWLPPETGASSMHQIGYTQRDALYAAGMLNVFQRHCNILSMANLAQLVNVLPLIVTTPDTAYATPLYYPFLLYQRMQPVALRTRVQTTCYDSLPLGNVAAIAGVPYVDLSATRDDDGSQLTLGLINRHPTRAVHVVIELAGFTDLRPRTAWLLHSNDPLATNSAEQPGNVQAREVDAPNLRDSTLYVELPSSALWVGEYELR